MAEIQIPIKDELKQQHGFAHGGVVCYAADNAITFVGGSLLGERVVTAEFKINFLRPCVGARLVARASVIHQGKRSVVCRCDVLAVDDKGERLCASAQGTVSSLDS